MSAYAANVRLNQAIFAIGVITLISGLVQMILPDLVLVTIGAENAPASSHFFAIIGMFMTIFALLLLHALGTETQEPIIIFWCSIQKLGASIAVAVAVSKGLFSSLALLVAGFDLISFAAILYFWASIRHNTVLAY